MRCTVDLTAHLRCPVDLIAPDDREWAGWLDLGDSLTVAYGPFQGYASVADPRNAAKKLIQRGFNEQSNAGSGRFHIPDKETDAGSTVNNRH